MLVREKKFEEHHPTTRELVKNSLPRYSPEETVKLWEKVNY